MNSHGGHRGRMETLTSRDGHVLEAWCVAPSEDSHWAVVVLHEIFGVNPHIREVCATYAALGAAAVAPALFDRARRGVSLSYDGEGIEEGRSLREKVGWDAAVADVRAAVDFAGRWGPVAVVGYCWGGTLAFLAATRFENVCCAVSYYGGQTVPFASERIRVPVLMHFGSEDPRIPQADREVILSHNPDIESHLYPADHGFNCNHRKEWHAASAKLAMERTTAFLSANVEAFSPDVPQPS